MITVQDLINQLAKFPRGAKVCLVDDKIVVMLRGYTGSIHCPSKGRQRKLDMGEFAGWTDMFTEPDARIRGFLLVCPEQAQDLAAAAVLNLYMADDEPWLNSYGDFPSGCDYIDSMTTAMDRVGLAPLIQELQDEADEQEEDD
jgi:hypothetical protein